MKKLVWVYRILLGLFLLAMLILLAVKGFLWFINLFAPYSVYALLGGILIAGICIAINALRRKRTPSEPLVETLADAQVSIGFAQLAEQYGITLAEDDSEFRLDFQNLGHAIWCVNEGSEFIVGLLDSPHHEHYSNIEDAHEEIEAIRAEKKVQMIFFDAQGTEHWNDLYFTESLDAEIFARFHSLRAPQAWWERCLRIVFLFFSPITPKVLRAEIYSYRGTYDRKIFREE